MSLLFPMVRDVVAFLEKRRWPLADEKDLQAAIAFELTAAGLRHEREVRLSEGDVIDFMVFVDIGVEIKIKGTKRNVYRQCERYCGHERVKALVLATNYTLGFPPAINGKPIYVANLGKAWL